MISSFQSTKTTKYTCQDNCLTFHIVSKGFETIVRELGKALDCPTALGEWDKSIN